MVKIQINISEDLSRKINIIMAKYSLKNKRKTTERILEKYFEKNPVE